MDALAEFVQQARELCDNTNRPVEISLKNGCLFLNGAGEILFIVYPDGGAFASISRVHELRKKQIIA